MRATLAFTDPPGSLNASHPVVNDLNLVLEGPSDTFLGNVFAEGQSGTGGVPDPLNTVEQVLLTRPEVGRYTALCPGERQCANPPRGLPWC